MTACWPELWSNLTVYTPIHPILSICSPTRHPSVYTHLVVPRQQRHQQQSPQQHRLPDHAALITQLQHPVQLLHRIRGTTIAAAGGLTAAAAAAAAAVAAVGVDWSSVTVQVGLLQQVLGGLCFWLELTTQHSTVQHVTPQKEETLSQRLCTDRQSEGSWL